MLWHEEVRGSIASLLKSFRLLLHALFDLQDCLGFILKDKLVSFGRHNFTWFVPINNWLVHSIVNMGKEIENIFSKQKSPSSPSKSVTFCPLFPICFLIDMGEGVEAFKLSYSYKKKAKTHILSSRRKVWHVELQVLIAFSRGRRCCRWAALHIVKVRAAVLRRAKSSNR